MGGNQWVKCMGGNQGWEEIDRWKKVLGGNNNQNQLEPMAVSWF